MSSQVDLIKERLSIVDVVGSYLKLDRAGGNLKARCPFHNEKTPSFFVSPARSSFYCFGCGAKGDIFTFVQEFEGLDFFGALKVLAERAGVELKRENREATDKRNRLHDCLSEAEKYYSEQLLENTEALAYLRDRGLTEKDIFDWKLGFAPKEWRALYEHLLRPHFTSAEILEAGLIKHKNDDPKNADYYDRMRSRITFPLFDSSGRVIGFSGRIFPQDDTVAKYLNGPETSLFNKSSVLYGLHLAKHHFRERGFATAVEGQMDLILAHSRGYKNTVAVSGTALTLMHLSTIKRFTSNVVFAFDPDRAGMNAALRSARLGLALGLDVKVARLPKGQDPADLIRQDQASWERSLKAAEHVVLFALNAILDAKADEREKIKKIRDVVLPLVADIESSMEQGHFAEVVARRTSLPVDAVLQDVERIKKNVNETRETEAKVAPRVDSTERRIFGILMWQTTIDKPIIEIDKVGERLKLVAGQGRYDERLRYYKGVMSDVALEAEIFHNGSKDLLADLEQLISSYEEDILKESFAEALKNLSEAERKKEGDKASEFLARCKEISERLSNLTKNKPRV